MKRFLKMCSAVMMIFLVQVPLGYCQVEGMAQEGNPESEEPPLDIILVLDNSGSMKKNDPKFLTREVVTNFVNGLGENSRLGMVIFDQEARLAEPLNELSAAKAKATFLMSLDKVNYRGQFTNSPAGIERAIYELKTNAREDAQKVIIFLTDGIVDTGDKDKDLEKEKWLKEDLAQESQQEGIRIFGVAFTDKADFRLIQSLAHKTDGEYFRAYKAEDIQEVFQNIHAVIRKPLKEPEVPTTQTKRETPTVAPEEKVASVPPATEPKTEKEAKAEKEKMPKPVKQEAPLATIQSKVETPSVAPVEKVTPAPPAAQPKTEKEAKAEKALESVKQETPQPAKEKKGISQPLIFAGIIVLAGIFILVFILRGKSKPQENEIRPAAQTPIEEPPMPKVQLMDTKNIVSEKPLVLDKRSINIGRDINNDITIPKDTISSLHATIEFKNGYFHLEDQRSSNGTSLNNRKIEANKPIRLKSGDRIKFDIYEFTFFIPGQAPIGKTVLTGGEAVQQSEGTVLRTSKSEEEPSKSAQEKQPEDKKPESPPIEQAAQEPEQKFQHEAEPPEQDRKTRIKSGMCPNHASLRATELCSVCKTAFCKKCMTEKDGKVVCVACAEKL